MIVHVDGDVIVYRAGYAAEHNFYHVHYMEDGKEHIQTFDGAKGKEAFLKSRDFGAAGYWVENETKVENEEAALYNTRSIIRDIADSLKVDLETEVKVYLSGPTNYRLGIATIKPYKGNRDPTKKPVHAAAIKELIRNRYDTKVSDGQEADDDMAQAHVHLWTFDPESTVIATIDKDLDTVPGLHYNFVTKESYVVTPREAKVNFWKQMITGDTVDNIPGIPKAGPAKAAKLLDGFLTEEVPFGELELCMYKVVREEYRKSYKDKADEALLEMGRLLFIRHDGIDWWGPPNDGRGGWNTGGADREELPL
jgi:hypothetical protein